MTLPKAERKRRKGANRHNPLHEDVLDAQGVPLPGGAINALRNKKTREAVEDAETVEATTREEAGEDGMLPPKLGKKLLKLVEEQQKDEGIADGSDEDENVSGLEEEADKDGFVVLDCEEDEEDVAFYKQKGDEIPRGTINLADLVMEQLRKQTESAPDKQEEPESSLSPKVVEVYTAMAPFLARYRSGKVPKAFKIIPRLHAWEEVLVLTNPPMWSKQATREATRIFCSNLREAMAQRFLCTVLLPAVRDDIAENKKLNCHLYMALKKSLFKPGAFFKGIYLPLALNGCTIREAIIVGSVVAKVSIPVLHGAAALFRLAAVEPNQWIPSVSLMMTVLIDKKYSLPIQAIDECVNHFHRFLSSDVKVTVAWHKCLLVLVQRYKVNLTASHRAKLKEVLKVYFHDKVGPEIRRELAAQQPALLLEQQQRALLALAEEQKQVEAIEVD
ncbi:bystin, putative [Eimeria acervulina]|uniref:Bystin, putative n=1 Tax=Eimeria acervulina TaxID=5801 RepID=U6G7G1_EIMAC|nr:bystin, putative [Eimeria acervulina]CDI76100.1 bystin, putative [Eimeria acervulina]